jgi:hypothetical protein
MNAFQFAVAISVFSVSGHAAWARIGETEAQISARYGTSIGDIPTATFGSVRGYMVPGVLVGVKLVDGISQMEMISKTDQSDMSVTEIEVFLNSHGARAGWNVDSFKPNWKRWRTQDGALIAVYDTVRHFLYINSKKFYEAQGERIGR